MTAKSVVASRAKWTFGAAARRRDHRRRRFGGTTFRREAKRRGLEPDECYEVGKLEDGVRLHITVEVIVSSALVDKMAVYAGLRSRGLGVGPGNGSIAVHRLVGANCERTERSEALADFDIALLKRCVQPGENQTRLAKAYQVALRSH